MKNHSQIQEWIILGQFSKKPYKSTRLNPASAKAYGVLFTCITTRAVRLELAREMSTNTFVFALRRFISRRGFVEVLR